MHDRAQQNEPFDEPVDEIVLRIQALVDNELPEDQIDDVLAEIQGSYEYRREYAELLRVKRRVAGKRIDPPEDWLARAERKVSRRISRGLGLFLVLGSYIVLLGFAISTLFTDPSVPLVVAVLVVSGILGFAVLLGNAIGDRVRESKNDPYREIIR